MLNIQDVITTDENYIKTTGKYIKQIKAGKRYYKLKKASKGFTAILDTPTDILNHMNINITTLIALMTSFKNSVRLSSHSFNICDDCSKKLRGHKIRKDAINKRNKCDLCNKHSFNNHIIRIRSKHTLQEALLVMKQSYPEIYI